MSKTRDTGFLNNVLKTDPQGNVTIVSGSTTLLSISSSGAITTTGVISGSNALSASYAVNADQLDGLDSTSFVFTSSYNTTSASFSTRTTTLEQASASFAVVSQSYSAASGSLSTRVTTIESKYATTGSNIFTSNQTICGNLTTTGTITAQTINVQQVTSSIVYSSGSNIFGNNQTNTQQFTGSMFITGSTLTVTGGAICTTGNTCFGGASIIAGCIGINTNSPGGKLQVNNSSTQYALYTSQGNLELYTPESNCGYVRLGSAYNLNGIYGNLGLNYIIESTYCHVFRTQSTALMTITSGGNVGIGCTLPGYKLDVNGTSAASSFYSSLAGSNSVGSGANIQLSTNGIIQANANCGIDIWTLSSGTWYQRVTLKSTGELSIGSTGIYSAVNANNESILLVVGCPPSVDTDRGLVSFMDSRAYNTTCLGARLMLGGTYNSSNAITYLAGLAGLKENTTSGDYAGALAFYTRPNGAGSSERMRITSAGVIGIGTTPAAQANGALAGSTEVAGILRIQGSGGRYFTSGDGLEISKVGLYSYNRGSSSYNSITINDAFTVTGAGPTCFAYTVCTPSLRVQSAFADLTLCGTNTTSPHLGGTFSITTNQDAVGRTIIGNSAAGRAMYLEANGNVTFNCLTNAYCFNSMQGAITSNGLITYSLGGYMYGNTATYFDFPTWNDGGQGQIFEIKAFFEHYFNWGYGTGLYKYMATRETNNQDLTMFNCVTGNGGCWIAYKTSNTNLRVCKIAGSYAGGGAYWIQVTAKMP